MHEVKQLNSIIQISPHAVSEAALLDAQRKEGNVLPLHGIPILVKDNIATAGLNTTAGSYTLLNTEHEDARLIQKLKAAGAIVLAKTNMDQW